MLYSTRQRLNPLDRDAAPKYYAVAEYTEEMDINALANDISKFCTLTPADIVAVIESLLERMPQYLKNSNRIKLDNFGIFKLSFRSGGQAEENDVSAKDIKNLRVLFTPSSRLKKELADVVFMRK